MPEYAIRLVHVANVEEVTQSNYLSFLTWHLTCPQCGIRYRLNSGASNFTCPRCQVSYVIKPNGEIHRQERVEVPATRAVASSDSAASAAPKSVGFLAGISAAFSEANEVAHGRRLREGLSSTGDCLKSLDPRVLEAAMVSFVDKCAVLERERINWSQAGRIRMGRDLQTQARQKFDFNQAESFALWLAGAWLESSERLSPDAAFVHDTLERLRARLE